MSHQAASWWIFNQGGEFQLQIDQESRGPILIGQSGTYELEVEAVWIKGCWAFYGSRDIVFSPIKSRWVSDIPSSLSSRRGKCYEVNWLSIFTAINMRRGVEPRGPRQVLSQECSGCLQPIPKQVAPSSPPNVALLGWAGLGPAAPLQPLLGFGLWGLELSSQRHRVMLVMSEITQPMNDVSG